MKTLTIKLENLSETQVWQIEEFHRRIKSIGIDMPEDKFNLTLNCGDITVKQFDDIASSALASKAAISQKQKFTGYKN